MQRVIRPLIVLILVSAGALYWYLSSRPVPLVLTGIVTTNDVVVSPQIAGRITQLAVNEGDEVKTTQVLAVLDPGELQQEQAFYTASAAGASSQVQENAAALTYQQRQVADQINQAQANLAATESQQMAAQAQLDNANVSLKRSDDMLKQGVISQQELDQARTSQQVAQSALDALRKQIDAQRAAVALAQSNAEQVSVRRSQL